MRGGHIFNGGVDICQPVGPINNWRKNYLIAMTVMPFFTWIKKHPRLGPLPHCVGQADVRELVQAKIWFDNMNECFSARLLVTYSGNMVLFLWPPNSRPHKPVKPKKEDFFVVQPLSSPSPLSKSLHVIIYRPLCTTFSVWLILCKLNPKQYCSILDSLIAQGVYLGVITPKRKINEILVFESLAMILWKRVIDS